jgi:ankyrin repeat protein
VSRILGRGADPNATDEKGNSALWLAEERGRDDVGRLLIERGARLDSTDSGGTEVMYHAALNGNVSFARLLLDAGVDIDKKYGAKQTSALMTCAWSGHPELARLLIERGADVNACDERGLTPLMGAARRGLEDTVKRLIAHGADLHAIASIEDALKPFQGWNALKWAAAMGKVGVVRLLLERDSSLLGVSEPGVRAIHHAIEENRAEVLMELMKWGESPDGTLPDGRTYDDACSNKPECLAVLHARRSTLAIESVIERASVAWPSSSVMARPA